MTHRQRALAAIQHAIPDRVPLDSVPVEDSTSLRQYLGIDQGVCLDDCFDVDFRHFGAGTKTLSLFGNSGSQQPYGLDPDARPFAHATQVKDIERFRWPTIDEIDFHGFDRQLDALRPEYAIVVGNQTANKQQRKRHEKQTHNDRITANP